MYTLLAGSFALISIHPSSFIQQLFLCNTQALLSVLSFICHWIILASFCSEGVKGNGNHLVKSVFIYFSSSFSLKLFSKAVILRRSRIDVRRLSLYVNTIAFFVVVLPHYRFVLNFITNTTTTSITSIKCVNDWLTDHDGNKWWLHSMCFKFTICL